MCTPEMLNASAKGPSFFTIYFRKNQKQVMMVQILENDIETWEENS